MGGLNWNGFMDDPLGLRSAQDQGMSWEQPTVAMRSTNWNEALHMQCGPLAAITRATGNRRYLDEALRLIQDKPGLPINRAITWASANANQLPYLTVDATFVAKAERNVVIPYRWA